MTNRLVKFLQYHAPSVDKAYYNNFNWTRIKKEEKKK
jgi:hypothetical protein